MTKSLTERVEIATQQVEDAGEVYSKVKCADSNTMVDTGCGMVPSLRKVLKDLGGYQYKGVWKPNTVYEAKDQVKDADGAIWLCIENHTSSADFDVDAKAGKWIAFQVIHDTPVFNRRVVEFGVGVAFGPYEEDGRTLLPRLRIGAVEYVAVSEITENLTFTSDSVDDRFDGTVVIQTSIGSKSFSKVSAEALNRGDVNPVYIIDTEHAKSIALASFDRVLITDRADAPFEKIDADSAVNYPESSKFISSDGQNWGLVRDRKSSVRWFGAKGNNVGDESQAFKDAGKNCFIPAGHYLLSDVSLYGMNILGSGRNATYLQPFRASSNVLNPTGNDGIIENFSMSNPEELPQVTGVHLSNGSKFYSVKDVRINSFEKGLFLEDCTYSLFENVMLTKNKVGIKIGLDGSTAWNGALTFVHTYMPSGRIGVQNSTTNNTVTHFYSTVMEGQFRCIENYGSLTCDNGYYGDGGRYTLQAGDEPKDACCYTGYAGSHATFTGGAALAGAHNFDKKDGSISSLIHLKGVDGNGARITLNNKNIYIGDQYDSQGDFTEGTKRMFAYQVDSKDDKIEFNNVECHKSTVNRNHNQAPIIYYRDFTPLTSKVALPNYIVNGTFSSDTLNKEYADELSIPTTSTKVSFDTDYMNQYGGKVMVITSRYGIKLRYSVPAEMVGKEMALITWTVDVGPNTNAPRIYEGGSDLIFPEKANGLLYLIKTYDTCRVDGRTPQRAYIIVKPTKQNGVINVALNWFTTPDGLNPEPVIKLGSIILTDLMHMTKLDKFIDVSNSPRTRGRTIDRPSAPIMGEEYFDIDLGYPIWWRGNGWVNGSGVIVS